MVREEMCLNWPLGRAKVPEVRAEWAGNIGEQGE